MRKLILLLLLLYPALAHGQALPAPVACQQFFAANGTPLAGGFLYTYASGTLTPQATYTDYTQSTPNANPIILNAGGFATSSTGSCGVFLNPNLTYRFVLQNASSSQQWQVDGITASNINTLLSQPNTWTALQTFSGGLSTTSFTATTLSTSALEKACFLDGVTNTTLAAAVACATARGGTVWVPPSSSNYTLAGTVTLTSGIDLECLGGTGLSSETNGPCTFSVSPGVTALQISGNHVKVEGLHFISQDTSSGTDDCIRIQGDFTRLMGVTCEHFGRDGFRIDSTGGSGFADFAHIEDSYAYLNYGDGFHWAATGVDENAGVCLRCDAYNNVGYGMHAEQGADNILIDPTVQFNTAGGYYFTNATGWNILNPYCEAGTGSTFNMAAAATGFHVATSLFGQCTTITNVGGLTNQYDYFVAGQGMTHNGLYFGPDFGATGTVIYEFLSGANSNNGWYSLQDLTDNVVIQEYNPISKIFYTLVPQFGTANAIQYYVPLTGNNGGSHNDSGFLMTGTAAGCTTGSSQGNACASPVTITWPNTFADGNYKATCSSLGAPTNYPSAIYIVATSAASMTVNYIAMTAAAASWPNIECTAVHN